MPAIFPHRFATVRNQTPPATYRGTIAVAIGKALVSDTTAFTVFTLPQGARPILWLWSVEDAFNGTTPTMAITVNGAGVTIATTNMSTTGDKFPFVGTTLYPSTGRGYDADYPVTAQFSGGGSNTTGTGWLKCLYTMD